MTTTFERYVRSFYGPKGIYSEFFATAPPQAHDFRAAIEDLVRLRKQQGIEFAGDSFDRETVRDILFVRMGILPRGQTEFQTHMEAT